MDSIGKSLVVAVLALTSCTQHKDTATKIRVPSPILACIQGDHVPYRVAFFIESCDEPLRQLTVRDWHRDKRTLMKRANEVAWLATCASTDACGPYGERRYARDLSIEKLRAFFSEDAVGDSAGRDCVIYDFDEHDLLMYCTEYSTGSKELLLQPIYENEH